MRSATSNQDVIRTCESKIRESIKTIGWFEESVRELQVRGEKSLPNTPIQSQSNRTAPPGAAPSYVQPMGYGAGSTSQGRVNANDQASPIGVGGQTVYSNNKAQFTNLGKLHSLKLIHSQL